MKRASTLPPSADRPDPDTARHPQNSAHRAPARARRIPGPVRRATALALACGTITTLAGCQTSGSERPEQEASPAPTDTISVTPEAAPSHAAPSGAAGVAVVDSSPGGPKKADPLWSGLDKAASAGSDAYLRVIVHVGVVPKNSGTVTLTPDTPNSVSVSVDAKAVHKLGQGYFFKLAGTFGVKKTADSAYALTVKDTAERPDRLPKGSDTKARCTAPDAIDRIQSAADELADGKKTRAQLQGQWAAAPEVWWGIQLTAASLKSSHGDSAGDYLTEACEAYLPDDAG